MFITEFCTMCFQLATQGPCAHLSEGEKLTHELQLVEQGIREKEKELRLVCNISSEDEEYHEKK